MDDDGKALWHYYIRDDVWGLPAGRIEEGESSLAAARRELRERTGYDIDPQKLILIAENEELHFYRGEKKALIKISEPGQLGGYETEIKWAPLWDKQAKLFRYSSQSEGIFSVGKRLLPDSLTEEAWQARKWLPKPKLGESQYTFFLTLLGKQKYETTLLLVHQKYLTEIKCEEIIPDNIGTIMYQDEYQVVTRIP